MTRIEALAVLALATSGRKALIEALRTVDAYTGHSRDGMADLRAHAAAVAADLAPAKEEAKPTTTRAKRTERVRKALRPATTRKLAAVIGNATADENGVIVAQGEDFAAAGLGASWVRTPNHMWESGGYAEALAALGSSARSSRGTVVFTPVATEAQAVA